MKKMNNCITLKNLDKCRNTLLYLLSLQIPGNREKIIENETKITYCKSSAGTIIKQIENKWLFRDVTKNKKIRPRK